MTTDTAVLLLPAIVALVCWLFSWRRTPFAVGWAAVALGLGGVGLLWPELVLGEHHTMGGLLAAMLAGIAPSLAVTSGIEVCALEPPGTSRSDIAAWRQRRRISTHTLCWNVETRHEVEGALKAIVRVRDQADVSRYREIGRADPIADQATYLALIAEARNVADELNALKVGE